MILLYIIYYFVLTQKAMDELKKSRTCDLENTSFYLTHHVISYFLKTFWAMIAIQI